MVGLQIKKELNLFVERDDDFVTIHLGDILNKDVRECHDRIEEALVEHCPSGKATIISTEGKESTRISVIFMPYDEDSVEDGVKELIIEYS